MPCPQGQPGALNCTCLSNMECYSNVPSSDCPYKQHNIPIELALFVDFSKVYTQPLLIARHSDLQHPGCRVQPLWGSLHPWNCLIVCNQVARSLTQMSCSRSGYAEIVAVAVSPLKLTCQYPQLGCMPYFNMCCNVCAKTCRQYNPIISSDDSLIDQQ